MIFLSTAWQAAQPSFFIIASAAAMSSAAWALPTTSTSDAIPAKASFIVPLPDQLEKTRSDGTRNRAVAASGPASPPRRKLALDFGQRGNRRQAARSLADPGDSAMLGLLAFDKRRRRPGERGE